jgi:hypothetical protein
MKAEEKPAANCGNLVPPRKLPKTVVERMKLIFQRTHGRAMNQADRDFLGVPPCSGECCPEFD